MSEVLYEEPVLYVLEENLNRAEAAAAGLYEILDGLAEELSRDARYYAVLSCLSDIVKKLEAASDAAEELEMNEGAVMKGSLASSDEAD